MECTSCNNNTKSCPLNHVGKKIHRAFAPNPRRITTTTAASNHHHRRSPAPIENPSMRVIEIQSTPPRPQQHSNHQAAVAFKPQEYGPSDYYYNNNNQGQDHKSGVHVEDSFSAYIGRVRKKLRTFSTVGGGGGDQQRKQGRNKQNVNTSAADYRFSDYISNVKNKFARTLTAAAPAQKTKPFK